MIHKGKRERIIIYAGKYLMKQSMGLIYGSPTSFTKIHYSITYAYLIELSTLTNDTNIMNLIDVLHLEYISSYYCLN
jgi:hypothetical protein